MFFKTPEFWYQNSKTSTFIRSCLKPFATIYKLLAIKNLKRSYAYKSKSQVIAIGGLTVGGSGKTPVVASFCTIFKRYGYKTAVLSRGFGRNSSKILEVNGKLHTYKEVGDEPLLLTQYSDVFVGANRAKTARKAEETLHSPLIMDDGLTQRDLQPDICIAVIDNTQGFGNGELLPLGPNRLNFEILKSAKKNSTHNLDAVAIIKASIDEEINAIKAQIPNGINVLIGHLEEDFLSLKKHSNTLKVQNDSGATEQHVWQKHSNKTKKIVVKEGICVKSCIEFKKNGRLEEFQNSPSDYPKFLVFCGIGYPQKFFRAINKHLEIVKQLEFPDHYPYSDEEIVDLLDEARLLGAQLLTTEKDMFRIPKQYHNFISVIPVRIVWENYKEVIRVLGIDKTKKYTNESQNNHYKNCHFSSKPAKKIFIASDHAGFQLKNYLLKKIPLIFSNLTLIDLGTYNDQPCDYPIFANKLVRSMSAETEQSNARPTIVRGVLICGTGIGMSIAANRSRKIRAALCSSPEMAEIARKHNDANVLVLGARVLKSKYKNSNEIALECFQRFLETKFEEERHTGRVSMLETIYFE